MSPRTQPFIVRHLSQERFQPYLDDADGDGERAWALYRWNLDLVAATSSLACDFEVVLRNTIHRQLGEHFKCEDWWTSEKLCLDKNTQDMLEQAIKPIGKKLVKGSVGPGQLVANLMLGCWVSLLSKGGRSALGRSADYELQLWRPALRFGFAKGETTPTGRERRPKRSDVFSRASNFQKLRNAAAHHRRISEGIRRSGVGEHEPRIPLLTVWEETIEMLGWMSPEIADIHVQRQDWRRTVFDRRPL